MTRAARIAAAMTLAAALVALAVDLLAASAVRRWLHFPFGGIEPRLGSVLAIFLNNARLLGALILGALLGQLAKRTPGTAMRILTLTCDAVIVLACANETFDVGATVGAYGARGVRALLPHGPVELLGFSVALSMYVAARRERLAPGRAATLAMLSGTLLAVAATLEVLA